jgi:hypothetical protein
VRHSARIARRLRLHGTAGVASRLLILGVAGVGLAIAALVLAFATKRMSSRSLRDGDDAPRATIA